jgi:putative phosphoesterase
MTRVLVLSDTHLPRQRRLEEGPDEADPDVAALLDRLADYLKRADLVLHAGDHTEVAFYEALRQRGNLHAVRGNMDALPLQKALPEFTEIQCESVRIGLLHGWGSPYDLPERIFHAWPDPRPQILIFGHSHEPYQAQRGGCLLFNPGSAVSPRRGPPTCGWIEVEGDQFAVGIHLLTPG